ncbi:lyase [Streptomyces sp. WAC05374]|uniref:polysaccharide lyase 8 family protein n=1 Tax=Streptomyces sp. WAC05374 TaxID=2487420 RepID=UPI000F860663|nr:lyase [Streptomyces sp. WAC05374]TDF40191.1 lyase [Streptomyces sp. WAC05374]TDF53381.1 lyase [Streptomyces sp. WAC05374]TDF59229.1 lyase [Streptomyces sp. WAC05374]
MPPTPSAWSRRTFLAATSTAALGLTVPARATPRTTTRADDFDTLRLRWLGLQLGTGYDPAAAPYASRLAETGDLAARYRATMAPTDTSLWPGHPFSPPSGITQSYHRLWTMTQAYAQEGTGHTGDPGLLADVLTGLDHLSTRVYNPSTTRYGNWWEWQIGSPRLLMDITATLYDDAGPARVEAACAAVDHFIPDAMLHDYSGTSTGANRVDLCRSVALRGLLGRSPAKLALARDALSPVFPYVTTGDGLYADGSFVQHTWVAYSGTYGQVMLDGLGRLFALLAGSPWDVTDPNRRIVLDSVEHAYAPLLYNGLMMDSVSGRAISRGILRNDPRGTLRGDHFHGQGIIAAIALLAAGAPAAERDRWHARVKGWIERDTVSPVLTAGQFGVADLARLHAVTASPVPAAPEPVGHKLFSAMDRAVHRRPGWAANISMASERIAYYECGNGENPRGWHTGAGMLYWWGPGGDGQYTDWFWPTVDFYRLPGTTVSTKRLPDRAGGEWGVPKPAVQWVGGVTDGEFAAVGQHLKGLGSTLEARKSWFCAADAVVCLGAGITCADGVPVETIVDNRKLGEAGDERFTTGPGTRWAHLEGHGGWVFPGGGAPVKALREDRTGAWRDINTTSSTERRTRRYQTLWLDHGTDPVDAAYAYLLMPGASRRTVAARAYDPHWLEILDNTADHQAVAVPSLGLTAANFWRPGTVGPLTASAPASVLVRRRGRRVTVCVSEPPRTGRPVEITWHHPARHVDAHDPSVEVLATGRSLRLRVAPGTAGAGHRCTVVI